MTDIQQGRIAVYAATFDPPTLGHISTIKRASHLFDHTIVAIGENPKKKPGFTLDERLELLRRSTRGIPNISIDSFPYAYAVDYVRQQGAQFLIRGIRNEMDYLYERGMSQINHELCPEVETVTLLARKELSDISSSMVKDLVGPRGWEERVERFVPAPVYNSLLIKNKGFLSRFTEVWNRIGARGDPVKAYDSIIAAYGEPHRFYHTLAHIGHGLSGFDTIKHLSANPAAVEMAWFFHDSIYAVPGIAVPGIAAPGIGGITDNPQRYLDNERLSAEFSYCILKEAKVDEGFCKEVTRLIYSSDHVGTTGEHQRTEEHQRSDIDSKIMSDVDLMILGAPWPVFHEYDLDIREEYIHVPEEIFKKRRVEILEGFLYRGKSKKVEELKGTRRLLNLLGGVSYADDMLIDQRIKECDRSCSIYNTPRFQERYEAQALENLAQAIGALKK